MSRRKWLCIDCKVDTGKIGEHYMLIDSVWQKIHTTNIGMFCILCAEKRLGRILTKADFNSSHINRISPGQSKSNRLLQRLHNEI